MVSTLRCIIGIVVLLPAHFFKQSRSKRHDASMWSLEPA